jgi:hypothetical protein
MGFASRCHKNPFSKCAELTPAAWRTMAAGIFSECQRMSKKQAVQRASAARPAFCRIRYRNKRRGKLGALLLMGLYENGKQSP